MAGPLTAYLSQARIFWRQSAIYCSIALLLLTWASTQSEANTFSHTSIQPPLLNLSTSKNIYTDLAPYSYYYENQNGQIDINTLVTQPELFQPIKSQDINFGFSKSQFVVKLNLKNDQDKAVLWKISTGARSRRLLAIYDVANGSVTELLKTTDQETFDQRPIKNHLLYADLQFNPQEEKELYIQFESVFSTRLALKLMTEETFQRENEVNYLILGLFVATMLTLILVNVLQYIALQSKVYLYYSIMAVFSTLYVTQNDGFNFQYLWPNNPGLDHLLTSVIAILAALTTIQVFRSAIQLQKTAPRLDNYLGIFMAVWALLLPANYFIDSHAIVKFASGAAIPLSTLILFMLVIVALHKKVESSFFYLAGWCCYLFSNSVFLAIHLGFHIVSNTNTVRILLVGVLAEAIILAIALAHQTRSLRRKHDDTQGQYIDLLEARLMDQTLLNQVEQEKREAFEESQRKTLKLASTSHDIYQPLYTMRAALTSIRENTTDLSALAEVDSAINYAESILKESIRESKADLSQQKKQVSLGNVFNELFSHNYRLAQEKNIKLKFSPSTLKIDGSRTLLLRIMDNLIKNAIRYSKRGKVLYGVRRRNDSIELQVIDTGPGISPQEMNNLLKPFQRGAETIKNDTGPQTGFGLGLNIVKTLCEKESYRFDIKSEPGVGTAFCVTIPVDLNLKLIE